MPLQLKSLRLFLAVARLGSFVAAANRENTVQSNVTAHVKKLEAELGVRLFDRRSGDLRLTPAGRRLLGQAEAICRLHDEAVDDLTGRGAPRGTLRIGTMETTAAVRLPPVLTAFHRRHPEVDVVLSTGPTADLLAWLRAGDLDGAFVAGDSDLDGHERLRMFQERLVLVAGRPLAGLPSDRDLSATRFFAFRQGCSYRQRIDVLLSRRGVPPARISEFGSLDAIVGCVAAGLGYAVLPARVVDLFGDRHALHTAELEGPELGLVETAFVCPAPPARSAALTAFIASLGAFADVPVPATAGS